ncbi:MAG: PilN domain-containing protein [Clostridia bacterium]|nr:PilN domain-containing protein [Clostridia bacterium]
MRDINLLPEEARDYSANTEKSFKPSVSMSPAAIIAIIIALVLMASSIAAPMIYVSYLEKTIEGLRNKINSKEFQEVRVVNNELGSVNGMLNKKNEILLDIEKNSLPVTQAITSVKNAVPKGCYITSLSYSNKSVRIDGVAENTLVMTEFLSSIDRLQNLRRSGANDSMSFDKVNDAYTFSITLSLGAK